MNLKRLTEKNMRMYKTRLGLGEGPWSLVTSEKAIRVGVGLKKLGMTWAKVQ